jgi:hypothetical protein
MVQHSRPDTFGPCMASDNEVPYRVLGFVCWTISWRVRDKRRVLSARHWGGLSVCLSVRPSVCHWGSLSVQVGSAAALAIIYSDIMQRLLKARAVDFCVRIDCRTFEGVPRADVLPGCKARQTAAPVRACPEPTFCQGAKIDRLLGAD